MPKSARNAAIWVVVVFSLVPDNKSTSCPPARARSWLMVRTCPPISMGYGNSEVMHKIFNEVPPIKGHASQLQGQPTSVRMGKTDQLVKELVEVSIESRGSNRPGWIADGPQLIPQKKRPANLASRFRRRDTSMWVQLCSRCGEYGAATKQHCDAEVRVCV
jgi:hypothetical protein